MEEHGLDRHRTVGLRGRTDGFAIFRRIDPSHALHPIAYAAACLPAWIARLCFLVVTQPRRCPITRFDVVWCNAHIGGPVVVDHDRY